MQENKKSTITSLAGTILMQIVLSAFAGFFFYYIVTSFVAEETSLLVSSILSILLILWISGTSGKNSAVKDHNEIVYGRQKVFMIKGFVSGLIAQIPGIIILVCYLIFKDNTFNVIFRLLYNSGLYFLGYVDQYPWIYGVVMLPFVLAAGIGYIIGFYKTEKVSLKKALEKK